MGRSKDPEWVGLESPATYADILRLVSNEREFLFSFAQGRPDLGEFRVVTQVYLPPQTAGELLAILTSQVAEYEKQHGRKITPENFVYSVQVDGEPTNDA